MTDHVARSGNGLGQANGAAPPATGPDAVTAPVFVLCGARSGSTLLRFVLDAHPELTCPPETNLPSLCAQVATVWSLIEGAPLSLERGDEPPDIPEAAIGGARRVMEHDDLRLPGAPRRGTVLRQEPRHRAVRPVAAARVPGRQVPVPVPAPDGRHRLGDRGVPVGPERLRLRPLRRGLARQRRAGASPPNESGSGWATTRLGTPGTLRRRR